MFTGLLQCLGIVILISLSNIFHMVLVVPSAYIMLLNEVNLKCCLVMHQLITCVLLN